MLLLSRGEQWNYSFKQDACLSILATRVQMGQTSTKTASDLVAKGYANLVHFSGQYVAKIDCFPDPVCARLAMALMDEKWSMKVEGAEIKGQSKKWWVEKTFDAFSGGLFVPDKGSTAEIFAALYLLFCGDLLRKEIDPTYKTFSVPLDCWVGNLIHPPSEPTEESLVHIRVERDFIKVGFSPSISFIQVCRNYMRPYEDYSFLACQSLLEGMYISGTAFYTFPVCPHFDIVGSIRYFHEGKCCYAPLLILVKAKRTFSESDANANCLQMENGLKGANCHRALCIVLVIGSDRLSDYEERILKKEDIEVLFAHGKGNRVMARVLKKERNDVFGISSMMFEATSVGDEISEMYSSHRFIRSHKRTSAFTPLPVDRFLRNFKRSATQKKKVFGFFKKLEILPTIDKEE